MSTGTYIKNKNSQGYGRACDYLGKTNESRVFKLGKRRDDYEPGYCNFYKKKQRKVKTND